MQKARFTKVWLGESSVEELDSPTQSPDLNPIKHLWDELEWRLRARPSRDLTKALLDEVAKTLHLHTPKSCKKPYQKSGSCYSCKRGTNSILYPMDLEWYIIKAPVGVMCRCPNTFVHIVHIIFAGTRGHCDLDLQAPKSNQFIFESKWMYLPNLKTLPQADLKICHLKNSTYFEGPLWPWHLDTKFKSQSKWIFVPNVKGFLQAGDLHLQGKYVIVRSQWPWPLTAKF